MTNLSDAELQVIIAQVGPPRAKGRKIPIAVEKVRAMRNAGFSMNQIAEYMGVSKMTIVRRLTKR